MSSSPFFFQEFAKFWILTLDQITQLLCPPPFFVHSPLILIQISECFLWCRIRIFPAGEVVRVIVICEWFSANLIPHRWEWNDGESESCTKISIFFCFLIYFFNFHIYSFPTFFTILLFTCLQFTFHYQINRIS